MIRWRRLFLHDMGRKGMALLLAVFLWYQADRQVSRFEDRHLAIEVAETPTAQGENSIQVVVPAGWVLTSPTPGNTAMVRFYGPGSELDAFGPTKCRARISVILDPRTEGISQLNVEPEDMEWVQPDEADALLRNVPEGQQAAINLVFDRRLSETVTLESQLMVIEGATPAGYSAVLEDVKFSPNQVVIHGPRAAVTAALAALARARSGAGGRFDFLEPVSLESARQTIFRDIGLVPALTERGVTMTPEKVRVTVPVFLEERVSFYPEAPLLFGTPPAGGNWEPEPWGQREWIASLARPPGTAPFDAGFALGKIRLYLDRGSLPESPDAEEFDLPVHWSVLGVEDEEQRLFYHRNLRVEPKSAADAFVKMRRAREEQE